MKGHILYSLVACLAVLDSCATTVPLPTAKHAEYASRRWPGTSLQDLAEGRTLYVTKCSGCHSLHAPDELPAGEWERRVAEMTIRSRLSKVEADLIVRYLESAAEVKSR